MTTAPKTIAGNDALMAVYNNIPKRTLWEILWDAGARLCPVGEESIDRAAEAPEAQGSIVEWIMGEAIVRECWLPKSVLKRDEPAKDAERLTDDSMMTVKEKKKTALKAASEKGPKAKKGSKKTSGKQEELSLPERMRS